MTVKIVNHPKEPNDLSSQENDSQESVKRINRSMFTRTIKLNKRNENKNTQYFDWGLVPSENSI